MPQSRTVRAVREEAVRELVESFLYQGWTQSVYLGRVRCRDSSFRVLCPDTVGTGFAGGGPRLLVAWLSARQADRAAVGHVVPDLDPFGRARPGRGVLGGRAAGRAPAAALVPAQL